MLRKLRAASRPKFSGPCIHSQCPQPLSCLHAWRCLQPFYEGEVEMTSGQSDLYFKAIDQALQDEVVNRRSPLSGIGTNNASLRAVSLHRAAGRALPLQGRCLQHFRQPHLGYVREGHPEQRADMRSP